LTPRVPETGACDYCQGELHSGQGEGVLGLRQRAQLCPRCLIACYCSDQCRLAAAVEHGKHCRWV
jgi:hypothetical protein